MTKNEREFEARLTGVSIGDLVMIAGYEEIVKTEKRIHCILPSCSWFIELNDYSANPGRGPYLVPIHRFDVLEDHCRDAHQSDYDTLLDISFREIDKWVVDEGEITIRCPPVEVGEFPLSEDIEIVAKGGKVSSGAILFLTAARNVKAYKRKTLAR